MAQDDFADMEAQELMGAHVHLVNEQDNTNPVHLLQSGVAGIDCLMEEDCFLTRNQVSSLLARVINRSFGDKMVRLLS